MNKKESIELDEKSISDLHSSAEDREIIQEEELEELKALKAKLFNSDVQLASLFIRCLDLLRNNLTAFTTENKDSREKLKKYLDGLKTDDLRKLLKEYNSGSSMGDYFINLNIQDNVKENRKEYEDLINLFFSIFGEES